MGSKSPPASPTLDTSSLPILPYRPPLSHSSSFAPSYLTDSNVHSRVPGDPKYRKLTSRRTDGHALEKPSTGVVHDAAGRERELSEATWGGVAFQEVAEGEEEEKARRGREGSNGRKGWGVLGQGVGTGAAGVVMAGSALFAFPGVIALTSVYAPVCVVAAWVLLFTWKPILQELGLAVPYDGGVYSYFVNLLAGHDFSLLAAAQLLLQLAFTACLTAMTAVEYLGAYVELPIGANYLTGIILGGIAFANLCGIRLGPKIMSACVGIHLLTMAALVLAAVVAWARLGNDRFLVNWRIGKPPGQSRKEMAGLIFRGICTAFLGNAGYDLAPLHVPFMRSKGNVYSKVVRNLHFITILNLHLVLAMFAVLPIQEIIDNRSVFASLALAAGGNGFRLWITIDAFLIMFVGTVSSETRGQSLLIRMAKDRILPAIYLKTVPITRAPFLPIVIFIALPISVFAAARGEPLFLAGCLLISWFFLIGFATFSAVVLGFTRASLPGRRTPFALLILACTVSLTLLEGVVYIFADSSVFLVQWSGALLGLCRLTSIRSLILTILGYLIQNTIGKTRWGWWDRVRRLVKHWGDEPVVLFVKRDELPELFSRMTYIKRNEESTKVFLVHYYSSTADTIPVDLVPHHRILDEAFPRLTINLVLIRGEFTPHRVFHLGLRLGIPRSMCFIGCPGPDFIHPLEAFGGMRILA